jgi:hypothetical protein
VGGFQAEAISNDFRDLAVPATDNVPFYETLAPFTATNPKIDPLTLNYLGIASELIGKPLTIPTLDLAWIELVRRRLQPRHATVDYIDKLQSADPSRTVAELQRLIDNAFDAEIDGGEIEDDYVVTLVNAVLRSLGDFGSNFDGMEELQNSTLELLRVLVNHNPSQWRMLLVSAIGHNLDFFAGTEERIILYEELDGLLSQSMTIDNWLTRLFYRRNVAWLFVANKDTEAAMQTVGEIRGLIQDLRNKLTASPQLEQIIAANADISLLTGDVYNIKQDVERSIREYREGLSQLPNMGSDTAYTQNYLSFELHSRLAVAPQPFVTIAEAAHHAILAAQWGRGVLSMQKFVPLAQVVLKATADQEQPELALDFCEVALAVKGIPIQHLAIYLGRQAQSARDFLTTAYELSDTILKIDSDRSTSVLLLIAEAIIVVLRNLLRRRQTISVKDRNIISNELDYIIDIFKRSQVPLEKVSDLEEIAMLLGSQRPHESRKP